MHEAHALALFTAMSLGACGGSTTAPPGQVNASDGAAGGAGEAGSGSAGMGTGGIDGAAGAGNDGGVAGSITGSCREPRTACAGKCLEPSELATNLDHCGSCGNACAPTAVCVDSTCGPGVTNVVPEAPGCGEMHLAVGDGTVYWTDTGHGTVSRVGVIGGPVVTIASNEVMPERIRVRGSSLFWLSLPATIRKLTLPNGAPTDVVIADAPVRDFVVSEDGEMVFYTTGHSVMRVPATGGTPVEAVKGPLSASVYELAIEGNRLAYAGSGVDVVTLADNVVATCGADLQDPSNVNCVSVQPQHDPIGKVKGLFVIAGKTYYTSDRSGQSIREIAIDSKLASQIYMIFGNGAADIGLYLGTSVRPKFLARGQTAASSLVLDATNLYWSSNCAINSVPRWRS